MKTTTNAPAHGKRAKVRADYKLGSRYNGLSGEIMEETEHTVTLDFRKTGWPWQVFHRGDVECPETGKFIPAF